MITLQNLVDIFPSRTSESLSNFLVPLRKVMEKYEINTPIRKAAFIAQIGHESGYFRYIRENLNYSKDGLLRVFPKYFNEDSAGAFARKPEMIASRVYANRMGNGDFISGDGWKYRGRGLIQVTGKSNYESFARYIQKPLEETIRYLETYEGACESAGWFWKVNNCNAIADTGDIVALTRRINGGTNGLEDRRKLYLKAREVFSK
jgi:putative chitinase